MLISFMSSSAPFWISEITQSYFLCLLLFGNGIKSSVFWFSLLHSFLMRPAERPALVRHCHRSRVQLLALADFGSWCRINHWGMDSQLSSYTDWDSISDAGAYWVTQKWARHLRGQGKARWSGKALIKAGMLNQEYRTDKGTVIWVRSFLVLQ